MSLFDACLCISKFKNRFCNPLITDSRDQSLISLSGRSTFLVNHSLALPLSRVPKNCTWVLVYLTPNRPCNFSHRNIPATNISYTSRSELPEYSSGDLYSISFTQRLNHRDRLPDFLLMHCVSCSLLDHDSHGLLMGIPKQFLLPAINTFWYLVQLLVPVGSFTLAFPHTILAYHLWHSIYAFPLPLVS